MSDMLIIPENLMALSRAQAGASSQADTTMAADNLLSEDPSEFWRSSSNSPTKTQTYFNIDSVNGLKMSINAIAIVGHNLYRGDQYRVFFTDNNPGGTHFPPTLYVPTSLSGSSNATGSYTDVDEGETPDANWMTPTAPSSNWIPGSFGFNTPASAPSTGANRQAFWVYVKVTGTFTGRSPTLDCSLYQNASLKAALGAKPIFSTTGQWIYFSWDASDLSVPDGSVVTCRLSCTTTGGSGQYISLGTVIWAEDPHNFTGLTDSGWLTYTPYVGSGLTFMPESDGGNNSILHLLSTTVSKNVAYIHFRSDRVPLDFDAKTEILPTLHGYVQVGVVIIGESWSPTRDIQHGPFIGSHDASSKGRTYGGQVFGSRRYVQRILSMPLAILTPEEAHTLFDRVIWRHGILKKFFVALMPGDATEGKHTGFLASLKNADHVMQTTPAEARNRSMTLDFEEEI